MPFTPYDQGPDQDGRDDTTEGSGEGQSDVVKGRPERPKPFMGYQSAARFQVGSSAARAARSAAFFAKRASGGKKRGTV